MQLQTIIHGQVRRAWKLILFRCDCFYYYCWFIIGLREFRLFITIRHENIVFRYKNIKGFWFNIVKRGQDKTSLCPSSNFSFCTFIWTMWYSCVWRLFIFYCVLDVFDCSRKILIKSNVFFSFWGNSSHAVCRHRLVFPVNRGRAEKHTRGTCVYEQLCCCSEEPSKWAIIWD